MAAFKNRLYIGIDPGVGGGLAALDPNGAIVQAIKMPPTPRAVYDWLMDLHLMQPGAKPPIRAVLERVSASPQMGVVSAFTFGKTYGALQMALAATSTPYDEIIPRSWQAALSCLSKGDKNVTKRRAAQLWPEFKLTHNTADALLLAEYGRRLHELGAVRL